MENEIAKTIVEQLGGNKFITMTGTKSILLDNNKVHMILVKNESKSNRLTITLEESDTYTMRFYNYRSGRMDMKKMEWIEDKEKDIKVLEDVHGEQLQEIFTQITGLDTHL